MLDFVKIKEWLFYQKDLPPDAANPQGRKTATRLFHIGVAAWMIVVTTFLLLALCRTWPSDKELSQAGLSAMIEEQTARAVEKEAAAARAEVDFVKSRPTAAMKELSHVEEELRKSEQDQKAVNENQTASDGQKQEAQNKVTEATKSRDKAKTTAEPDLKVLQTKENTASEKELQAAIARARVKASGEVPDHARHLVLLVMLLGALGGQIHALSSFSSYWGNQAFVSSWAFYYVVRPVIGGLLALIVYLGILGGILGVTVAQSVTSNLAIGAICLLTGLCSEMAVDKFVEVFKLLFQTDKAKERRDALDHVSPAVPKVTGLEPATVSLAARTTVKIKGVNFTTTCKALLGGVEKDAVFKSATELELPAASLPAAAGIVKVAVIDKSTGKTSDPAADLTVTP